MFDTVILNGQAPLREQFIHETTHWRTSFYHDKKPVDGCMLAGRWRYGVLRFDPARNFGHKALFKATHYATGLTVIQTSSTLTAFSFSLPRILYGTNCQHLHWQSEVDQGLRKAFEIVNEIADCKLNEGPWTFSRIDIARPVKIDFPTFKNRARVMRHSVCKGEPNVFRNSVHFKGENREIFAYDKELKEHGHSNGFTRVELRLRKDALTHPKYTQIYGPGPHLSLAAAASCYRDALDEFPKFLSKPRTVPDKSRFIAELLLCDIQLDGEKYDVLNRYLEYNYSNSESAARARKEIIASMAQQSSFQLVDAICWDAPWHFEAKPTAPLSDSIDNK